MQILCHFFSKNEQLVVTDGTSNICHQFLWEIIGKEKVEEKFKKMRIFINFCFLASKFGIKMKNLVSLGQKKLFQHFVRKKTEEKLKKIVIFIDFFFLLVPEF